MSGRQSWFVPFGEQLMVMKKRLPSDTQGGGAWFNRLRCGRASPGMADGCRFVLRFKSTSPMLVGRRLPPSRRCVSKILMATAARPVGLGSLRASREELSCWLKATRRRARSDAPYQSRVNADWPLAFGLRHSAEVRRFRRRRGRVRRRSFPIRRWRRGDGPGVRRVRG